jgi:hypothetical protein
MTQWLAFIGYILSWVLLAVHSVYIGNNLMYKTDNIIIFTQSVYYFQFVNLLVGNNLSQFYYGWRWMHGGFFVNLFQYVIPSNYYEISAPLSYKLTNLDANFIRNAGFSISLLIVALMFWTLISLTTFVIHKYFNKS